MHIICLTPLTEGVYNDHKADHITAPPDGWAYIPEDFPLPSTFPRLGSIEAEELTYTRDVEVQKEVTKQREVESFREVIKTREVPARDEEGNDLLDEDGNSVMILEEYTDFEPCTVTEEYTELETVTEQREYTMLTVTAMTEGTLPEPAPEPEAPTSAPSVWDELDAAYQEGVNGAYDQ